MKKINIPRIIWIVCLFLLLITILIMVMDYKINFQYLVSNKLYFYECSGNLCVTEVEDDNYLLYSKYECGKGQCPIYKNNINDRYALLEDGKLIILYDYREGKVISREYDSYEFINDNYIIVSNSKLKGVINKDNKVTIPITYDEIGIKKDGYLTGYNLNLILVKKNDKYGILSYKDGSVFEEVTKLEDEVTNLLEIIKNEDKYLKK